MHDLPENQTPTTFAAFFGQRLRALRTLKGYSQEGLGELVNASGTAIRKFEAATRSCPRDVAEHLDKVLESNGELSDLWAVANQEPHPKWFQPFVAAEAEAHKISEWQPQVISGLLQTREYATEVIRAFRPEASHEQIQRDVEARMSRHAVLDGDSPPRYWLILSEAALRLVVGSPAIMAEQLAAVLEAGDRQRVTIQVMPFAAGAHAATVGTLVILEGPYKMAFCEGHASGRLIADADEVEECAHSFSLLQSTALNVRDSLDLIRDVMEGYGS